MKQPRCIVGLKKVIEEKPLLPAELQYVVSLHPVQGRRVNVLRVAIDRVNATLRIQRRIVVGGDLSHFCDVVGFGQNRLKPELRRIDLLRSLVLIVALQPKPAGQQQIRRQRPGVLQNHIPRGHLRLRPVKKKTGSRVMKTVLAIPAHQMDLVRELVVQLDIKLGRGRCFGDRRIEIVTRVVNRTRRHGKRIRSVQLVPYRAHQARGNYFRAIRARINGKRLPVAVSGT